MTAESTRRDKTDFELRGGGGKPFRVRTLFYENNPDWEVRLVSSPDRMRAYIKLTPGPHFSGVAAAILKDVVAAGGVTTGVVDAALSLYAAQQSSPQPTQEYYQVARGRPMRKGEDGAIEFHVQPTSMMPRYDETESGSIDFKQLNLLENCFAGQRVASILPPGPGRPGTDIFGGEIPAQPGKPVSVVTGPGVAASANGRDFTSEIEGRLVYEKGALSVSPLLEINRDVDYSVGNVDFIGKVVVRGSLLDGFYVNAKQGVEVTGDVGAARITSRGNVKITGGVKGKNAAIIACRNLAAHYVDDATVEATGDVAVTKEIMNSSVKALGRVSIPAGSIVGGYVCGFKGVETESVGSEMGVPTRIAAGINWTDENKMAEIRAKIAEYLDRAQSAQVLLEPLLGDLDISARLGVEQKTLLSEVIAELRELRESLSNLLDERARIGGKRQVGSVSQLNVKRVAHMGVSVRFTVVDGELKDTVKGPLSVVQDESADTLRIDRMSEFPALEEDGDGTEEPED